MLRPDKVSLGNWSKYTWAGYRLKSVHWTCTEHYNYNELIELCDIFPWSFMLK